MATSVCLGVFALFVAGMSVANGQSYVELQKAMDETTVIEKVGGQVDLEARFRDLDGNWFSLKEFFFDERPVFLTLNYANCPMLCQNQLKMLAQRLDDAGLVAGKDFEFISISIDPNEARSKTREAYESFCRLYGGKSHVDGIHFLAGKKADIDSVARSIGFVYAYVPAANHYSHPPLCVALTSEGRISRYIHGLGFSVEELQESQAIAARSEVSEDSIASFVYRCLFFGANPGKYTSTAMIVMRISGAVTVLVICITIVPFWILSYRKGAREKRESGPDVELRTDEKENQPSAN